MEKSTGEENNSINTIEKTVIHLKMKPEIYILHHMYAKHISEELSISVLRGKNFETVF